MVKFDYIKKEWIVSPGARRVYRVSAWASVALFFWLFEYIRDGVPPILAPFAGPFVLIGAIGAGITVTGMEIYLFRFDESHPLKQMFWFCIMIFPLLGPALYCLLVYSRSKQVQASHPTT
jgi:hypothetical protein